jgi:tryptophan 7-halogenase
MKHAIESVVILGGGTAGWMSAAAIAKRYAHSGVKVTVVESSSIGSIGVGEATVPAIRSFIDDLGLDMGDVMRAAQASVKLGIMFEDWRVKGERFFHPFGLYGVQARGLAFQHVMSNLRAHGHTLNIADYSLSTQMALQNRFAPPKANPQNDIEVYDWAIHFDAGRFANYLKEFTLKLGAVYIDARLENVTLNSESGNISHLKLDNGDVLHADLFIDCSGFRGLLIRKALGTQFVDWKQWLPCDRAVAMPCAHDGKDYAPYTKATAWEAGWRWRIPLQHRVGNGYVYSSDHISDDEAVVRLRNSLEGEALADPNFIRFKSGHNDIFWAKNCVAIGLSAGFVEPLESTGITLIQSSIERLLMLFPDRSMNAHLRAEFNRITTMEYERIRDFIVLHYHATSRDDAPMWRACKAMAIPDSLAHKIEVYRAKGHLIHHEWESFRDPSWLSMYEGFGILPRDVAPGLDDIAPEQLAGICSKMAQDIANRASRMELHQDFLMRLKSDTRPDMRIAS